MQEEHSNAITNTANSTPATALSERQTPVFLVAHTTGLITAIQTRETAQAMAHAL